MALTRDPNRAGYNFTPGSLSGSPYIASEVAIDATGFDGNLATTDNTVQKVAQKLDDLTTVLPLFSSSNNTQVLKVVNGALAWSTDITGSGGFAWPTGQLTEATIQDMDRFLVYDESDSTTRNKYITLQDLKDELAIPTSSSGLIPTGGADDAVLRKTGTGNYAAAWESIREVPAAPSSNPTQQYLRGNNTFGQIDYSHIANTPAAYTLPAGLQTLDTLDVAGNNSKYVGISNGAFAAVDAPSGGSAFDGNLTTGRITIWSAGTVPESSDGRFVINRGGPTNYADAEIRWDESEQKFSLRIPAAATGPSYNTYDILHTGSPASEFPFTNSPLPAFPDQSMTATNYYLRYSSSSVLQWTQDRSYLIPSPRGSQDSGAFVRINPAGDNITLTPANTIRGVIGAVPCLTGGTTAIDTAGTDLVANSFNVVDSDAVLTYDLARSDNFGSNNPGIGTRMAIVGKSGNTSDITVSLASTVPGAQSVKIGAGDVVYFEKCARTSIDGAGAWHIESVVRSEDKVGAPAGSAINAWRSGTGYSAGDKVHFLGSVYEAKSNIANTVTETPAVDSAGNWELRIRGFTSAEMDQLDSANFDHIYDSQPSYQRSGRVPIRTSAAFQVVDTGMAVNGDGGDQVSVYRVGFGEHIDYDNATPIMQFTWADLDGKVETPITTLGSALGNGNSLSATFDGIALRLSHRTVSSVKRIYAYATASARGELHFAIRSGSLVKKSITQLANIAFQGNGATLGNRARNKNVIVAVGSANSEIVKLPDSTGDIKSGEFYNLVRKGAGTGNIEVQSHDGTALQLSISGNNTNVARTVFDNNIIAAKFIYYRPGDASTGVWVLDGKTDARDIGSLDVQDGSTKGPWAAGTLYIAGDTVRQSDSLYRCDTRHRSGASFLTHLANWTKIGTFAENGLFEGVWMAGMEYSKGSQVRHNRILYEAKLKPPHYPAAPALDSTNWLQTASPNLVQTYDVWNNSDDYDPNNRSTSNIVLYNNIMWQAAIVANVGPPAGTPPSAPSQYWQQVFACPAWSGSASYAANQYVIHSAVVYIATTTVASGGTSPDANSSWRAVSILKSQRWAAETAYVADQLVVSPDGYGVDRVFRARVNIPVPTINPPNQDNANWEPVITLNSFDEWQDDHTYNAGDDVVHNGFVYQCSMAHTVADGGSFDATKWDELFFVGRLRGPWGIRTAYKTGDYVEHDSKFYRCITAVTNTASDNSNPATATGNWTVAVQGGSGGTSFSPAAIATDVSIHGGMRMVVHDGTGYKTITLNHLLDFGSVSDSATGAQNSPPQQQPDRRAPQRSGGPAGQAEPDDRMHDPQFGP